MWTNTEQNLDRKQNFCCVNLQEDAKDLDALTLAKSYFDLKEYDRAAHFLKECCSKKAYFLYMYSRYLVRIYTRCLTVFFMSCYLRICIFLNICKSGEKKKDDETVDSLGKNVS